MASKIDPLSSGFMFVAPGGRLEKPRLESVPDLGQSQKDRIIGTAKYALSGIRFFYQEGPLTLTFCAQPYRNPPHPQLYCLGDRDLYLIPLHAFKADLVAFPFKKLDESIVGFFLEAYCHVHCVSVNQNVHLWLRILINDFEDFCKKESSLVHASGIDVSLFDSFFKAFHVAVYLLQHVHIPDLKKSLDDCLKHIDSLLLKSYQNQKRLEERLIDEKIAVADLEQKRAEFRFNSQLIPYLIRIVAGFHASWACSYLTPDSPKLADRAYVASYSSESVFEQSIHLTALISNMIFNPLEKDYRLKELEVLVARVNSSKKFFFGIKKAPEIDVKSQIDEMVSTVSRLRFPLSSESKLFFEQTLVRFFTLKRSRKWDFLAQYLIESYFHLFYPKKTPLNEHSKEEFGLTTSSTKYVKGAKLHDDLVRVSRAYLRVNNKKVSSLSLVMIERYLTVFINKMAAIAQAITCHFSEEMWNHEIELNFILVPANFLASESLKKLSLMCERIREELDVERKKIADYLLTCGVDDRSRVEETLDEVFQLLLKQSKRLICNPNFLSKFFFYKRVNALRFEGKGLVCIDITLENIDSIIKPLIHLGVCPPSFLELFEWRLEGEESSRVEFEPAQLVGSSGVVAQSMSLDERVGFSISSWLPAPIYQAISWFWPSSLAEVKASPVLMSSNVAASEAGVGASVLSASHEVSGNLCVKKASSEAVEFECLPTYLPLEESGVKPSVLPKQVLLTEGDSVGEPGSLSVLVKGSASSLPQSRLVKAAVSEGVASAKAGIKPVVEPPRLKIKTRPKAAAAASLAELPARSGAVDESFSGVEKSVPSAKKESEKTLQALIEELNGLMISGAKTRQIFTWLEHNGFEYNHHTGSHAIYMYKNGHHISIPDGTHLGPGLLHKLRKVIIAEFIEKES